MAIELVDFPIENGEDFPYGSVINCQRVDEACQIPKQLVGKAKTEEWEECSGSAKTAKRTGVSSMKLLIMLRS